ncbi:YcxB family protein [Streptomyces sp. NPDC127106]|uniref:YcxB family protein n=1 Tax=Streptomyces sp. NPDC127106 TaxID=3345360 RepID=UPI00362A2910
MNMHKTGQPGEPVPADAAVELVYEVTTVDLAQAIRVRNTATPALRRQRWLVPLIGVLLLVLGGAALAVGRPGVKSLAMLAGGLALCGLVLFGPRLQARSFAGLLAKAGETRTRVDGTGILVATARSSTRLEWGAQPVYAETADTFVLLDVAKGAAAMTVIPKRGVREPGDLDRLRALLDGHLRRL